MQLGIRTFDLLRQLKGIHVSDKIFLQWCMLGRGKEGGLGHGQEQSKFCHTLHVWCVSSSGLLSVQIGVPPQLNVPPPAQTISQLPPSPGLEIQPNSPPPALPGK